VIETNAGRHCVFIAVPPARYKAELAQGLQGVFRWVLRQVSSTLADELEGASLESRIWPFAGRRGFIRQAGGPGWALVGDGGYFKDPLTAHGITDALRDAELLADAAAEGTEAALARYGEIRDALSIPLFDVTDTIASFEWDLPTLQAQHHVLNEALKAEAARALEVVS
jgi:2-polyprenyl-6-methoxyphenol hydroxylase-like FAD-dependent oxidoreductase